MAINNPLSTLNGVINITSGTGAINVGADLAAKTITIGNQTGATAVAINAGTGNLTANSNGTMLLDSVGVMELNSSGAAISIGNDAVAQNINIGTGAAARVISIGNNTGASGVVINVGSAGLSVPSFTAMGALVSNTSGVISNAGASTAGFVLTSNGPSSLPTFQAPAGGGGFAWSNVTGTSQAMAVDNGYVANGDDGGPALVTFTLPATAAVGDIVAVQGSGAGGWRIQAGAGQTIAFNGAVSSAAGQLNSTGRYDTVYLMCVVADTGWAYNSGFGNYDIV